MMNQEDKDKFISGLKPEDYNCKTLTVFDIDPTRGDVEGKTIEIKNKGGKKK